MREAHWMILIGVVLIPFAVFVFRRPELFLSSGKSKLWVRMIGEEKTKKVVQYLTVPVLILAALFLILYGASEL